jgi:GNAT superfamily N-acetyltransferase
MNGDVFLRLAGEEDVPAITALCLQLGYPNDDEDVRRRLRALATMPGDRVFVAVRGTAVVGWIHLHVWCGVESGPDVEVGGIVVDERHRGEGVGRLLMEHAARWGADRGCSRVRLRSNVKRAGAHAFYQRIGFRVYKTQYAFEKAVVEGQR